MIVVDLKSLFARLNPYCKKSLENAAGFALAQSHYEITVEHFLYALTDDSHSDVPMLLTFLGVDSLKLRVCLEAALTRMKSGNTGRPVFSPLLIELVQESWLVASVTLGESHIRGASLLISLSIRKGYFSTLDQQGSALQQYNDVLKVLSPDGLLDAYRSSLMTSSEGSASALLEASQAAASTTGETALARFCTDFTAKARAGEIDPVFGRDTEIRQIIDILARRRKNNPICVGDPGVGKTAVAEGLALRIVKNDVPEFLRDTRLLALDMGLLEAGASVKGEFESRLRGVIDEIKAATQSTILFIDEAHMLIGAGGQTGGSDAANLLKPALARGELRTIAATTWMEYKRYFEKDPALARRFQLVKLDEPSVDTTVQILRGLKENYEKAHGVSVRDDAITAAAHLSDRYITGRKLPDKAVDLLDTACARIKVGLGMKPAALDVLERTLAEINREREALMRDQMHGYAVDSERLATLSTSYTEAQSQAQTLQSRWEVECEMASRVLSTRKQLADMPAINDDTATGRDVLLAQYTAACTELAVQQDAAPLIYTEVGPEAVACIVSDWTGVPLGKLQRDRASTLMTLADVLKAQIRGQDHALDEIGTLLKSSSSGLGDPCQPLGVFLLTGPSGTGKTATATAVAEQLFGGDQALVSIQMSEFQERHTVSRLIGSPPGYVGYGEGGMLTEAIRQRPYSVVLLDEVEKAHIDVLNLFMQVFDKGVLSDGEGREVDFSNTVIFLTSNLGTDEIASNSTRDIAALVAHIRPILSHHFKPALLARMTIVPFLALPTDALADIVRLKFDKIAERLWVASRIRLDADDAVIEAIAKRCTEVETGARNIDFIVKKHILPKISDLLLEATANSLPLNAVSVYLDDTEGCFLVSAINEQDKTVAVQVSD